MIVGFCGAGNMAAAMAQGWRTAFSSMPMLFSDSGSGRAQELAKKVGGEAVSSNAELAKRADLIVLALKPAQLEAAASELQAAKIVISVLGATPLERVAMLFPDAHAIRVMPNIAVEVRRGVLCAAGVTDEIRPLLEALGRVVDLLDPEFDAATAVMGCAPAYLSLAVEAIIAAGEEDGLDPALAKELVVETALGTSELLRTRNPRDVQKAVASPGGSTEAGLDQLERAHVRAAFEDAVRASLGRMRG